MQQLLRQRPDVVQTGTHEAWTVFLPEETWLLVADQETINLIGICSRRPNNETETHFVESACTTESCWQVDILDSSTQGIYVVGTQKDFVTSSWPRHTHPLPPWTEACLMSLRWHQLLNCVKMPPKDIKTGTIASVHEGSWRVWHGQELVTKSPGCST